VVITAGGDRFSAGEQITIEVEAYQDNFEPRKDETFEVEMVDLATGKSEKITLEKVPDRPGRYKKTIPARRTGAFELTALREDPQAADKVASKRIIVELPQAESRRTESDAGLMANVASRADRCLRVQEIDRLADLVPPGKLTTYREDPRELWDSNAMLLAIVVLLATEWILRKKYNMD